MRRNDILQFELVDNHYLAATENKPPLYLPVLQVLIDSLSGEPQEACDFFLRNGQYCSIRGLVSVKFSQA